MKTRTSLCVGLFLALLATDVAGQTDPGVTPNPVTGEPDCTRPFYPAAAIRSGSEGTTLLSFTITVEGRTKDISVVQSSGNADLDSAAVASVRCFRYRPAIKDGKPVEEKRQARLNWKLTNSDSWLDRLFH